jgi:hypothetical protein
MKICANHLLLIACVVFLFPSEIRAGVTQTHVVKRKLNADFLPTQCWEPTKQSPVLSLIGETENKTTALRQTNSGNSSTGAIANNDLRAYYYYLSDPE